MHFDNIEENIKDLSSGIEEALKSAKEVVNDFSKLEKIVGETMDQKVESSLLVLMFVPIELISKRVFSQIKEIHNFLTSVNDYDLDSLEEALEKEGNEEFFALKHCYPDDLFYLWYDLRVAEGLIANPDVFCPDTEESDRIIEANTLLGSVDAKSHSERVRKEKQRIQALSNKAWKNLGAESTNLDQFVESTQKP